MTKENIPFFKVQVYTKRVIEFTETDGFQTMSNKDVIIQVLVFIVHDKNSVSR